MRNWPLKCNPIVVHKDPSSIAEKTHKISNLATNCYCLHPDSIDVILEFIAIRELFAKKKDIHKRIESNLSVDLVEEICIVLCNTN